MPISAFLGPVSWADRVAGAEMTHAERPDCLLWAFGYHAFGMRGGRWRGCSG